LRWGRGGITGFSVAASSEYIDAVIGIGYFTEIAGHLNVDIASVIGGCNWGCGSGLR